MSVGKPDSRIKVTTIASGFAPETARSLTVPLMASSPIEPPGNTSGFTTKLSVVTAILAPLIFRCAASRQRFGTGTKKERSEKTFHQTAAGFSTGAVGHLNLRLAEADLGSGAPKLYLAFHAGELRVVTKLALRCS